MPTKRPERRMATSVDGKWVISEYPNHTLILWKPGKVQQSIGLKGHGGPVERAAFSPDGRWIAIAGDDRQIRVYGAGPDWKPSPSTARPSASQAFRSARTASRSPLRAMITRCMFGTPRREPRPHAQGIYRRCLKRCVQPRRHANCWGGLQSNGQGVGCIDRAGETDPQRALRHGPEHSLEPGRQANCRPPVGMGPCSCGTRSQVRLPSP